MSNFNQGIPGPATLINSSSTLLYGNSASANALSVQQLGAGNVATFRTTTGATALFVSSAGNVGIGQTNPVFTLDTSGTARVTSNLVVGGQSTPTTPFWIQKNAASGISGTAQSAWLGQALLTDANGTQFLSIGADQTNAISFLQSYGAGVNKPLSLQPNGGNVGIGTTNPGAPLHTTCNSASATTVATFENLNITNTTNKSFNIQFYGRDINFTQKDVGSINIIPTDGNFGYSAMAFNIRGPFSAGNEAVAEVMRFTRSGTTPCVGIGTTAPAAKLGVVVDGSATVTASSWDASWFTVGSTGNSIANAVGLGWQTAANTGVLACVQPTVAWRNMAYTAATHDFYINGSFVASIRNALTGGATTLSVDANGFIIRTPSDERLKTDVQPISYGLDTVNTFRPVSYKWVEPETYGAGRSIGLIAQEVALLVPEAVSAGGDDNKTLSLDYQKLVPVLTKAIQELSAENTVLKTQLASMDARLAALEARA